MKARKGAKYVEDLRESWGNATNGKSWEQVLEEEVASLYDEIQEIEKEHSRDMRDAISKSEAVEDYRREWSV